MNRSNPSTVVGGGEMNRHFPVLSSCEQRRRVRQPQLAKRHARPPPEPAARCASRLSSLAPASLASSRRQSASWSGSQPTPGRSQTQHLVRRGPPHDVVVVERAPHDVVASSHIVPQTMLSPLKKPSRWCPTRCCRPVDRCPTRCCRERACRRTVPQTMLSSAEQRPPDDVVVIPDGAPHDVVQLTGAPDDVVRPGRLVESTRLLPWIRRVPQISDSDHGSVTPPNVGRGRPLLVIQNAPAALSCRRSRRAPARRGR